MNLTILLILISLVVSNDKCRVLVLEGGGDKGSYQAGVLKAFAERLPKEEIEYDIITGISVGAINASFLSTFKKGDEINAFADINNKWENLDHSKVWEFWPITDNIFKTPGILNS